jgi:hypothetical protein
MDVDELMHRAWESVQKAELPEALQEAAFKEAVHFLRSEDVRRAVRDELGFDPALADVGRIRRLLVALHPLDVAEDYRTVLLPAAVEYQVAAKSGKKKKTKKKRLVWVGSIVTVGISRVSRRT